MTFADAERIRELAKAMTKTEIAAMYGVSLSLISRIVSGERWTTPPGTSSAHRASATNEPADDPHDETNR